MGLKTNRAFMINTLSAMLKDGETLYTPFYGCLIQRGSFPHNYFGFIGRTTSYLLIAILNPFDNKRIDWYTRVPLNIKKVVLKKSIIPKQYVIKVNFNVGNPCKIRMSKWLMFGDFIEQEQNVSDFIDFLAQFI